MLEENVIGWPASAGLWLEDIVTVGSELTVIVEVPETEYSQESPAKTCQDIVPDEEGVIVYVIVPADLVHAAD